MYIVFGLFFAVTMLLLVAVVLLAKVKAGIPYEVYVLFVFGVLLAWYGWAHWQVWKTWDAWRNTLNALLGLPTKGQVMSVEECERYRPGHLVPRRMRPDPTNPAVEAMKILAGRRP